MSDSRIVYDVVVGIGGACSCSQCLREAELQYLSFPYDWLYGASIERRTELLCRGFTDFLNMGDLEFIKHHPYNGMDVYKNKTTDFIHNHDFPMGMALPESFGDVFAKYQRRISRLLGLLETARSILVVYINVPGADPIEDSSVIKARELMRLRYPVKVDFLYFKMQKEGFVEYTCGEGVRVVSYDYQSHLPGAEAYHVDSKSVVDILTARYACRDYRNEEEKEAGRKRMQMMRGVRMEAKSAFDYRVKRLKMNFDRFIEKHIKGLFK